MDARIEDTEKLLDKLGRPRGRPPGGRPRTGKLNRATLQKMLLLQKELDKGKMPLDVMLEHMRFANDKANELTFKFIERLDASLPKGDIKALEAAMEQFLSISQEMRAYRTLALDAATRAAPYCHPKLNAIAMKINDPEGTRSIVDVNLIAATGAAVSDVIEHEANERAKEIVRNNSTSPDANGTIPSVPPSTVQEPAESRTESGDSPPSGS